MSDSAHILPLEEAVDVSLVGGKAINLAALLRAGFPVPGGFVITTTAFRAFAFSPTEIESAIRAAYRTLSQIENRESKIENPPVAVRSSATAEDMAGASMAGQYETFLDIIGEEAVFEAVKKCWQSLSTARTQAYLQQHNIDPANVAMAVVVQRLIPADLAGVMFTVNPRTANEDEILIEASYGLGETVVSGLVQPDTIILDKPSGAIRSYLIGTKEIRIQPGAHQHAEVPAELRAKRALSEANLKQLHAMALRAHAHFDRPQDTEWAIASGSLYLLQSRAVTTLASAKARTAIIEKTRHMLRTWKSQGKGDWARHNLGETLPHPTPLTWSVLKRFMTPAGGFGEMYRIAGYSPSPKLNPEGFLDLIAGRIYMDLHRASEMFFENFPFQYDTELLRTTPSAAQAAPTLPAGSLLTQIRTARRLNRAGKHLRALAQTFDHTLDDQLIPQFRQWIAEESQRDLTILTPQAWLETWQKRETMIMDDFAPHSLLPSLICGLALENLKTFLAPHMWQEDPEELANLLAAGGSPDATLRSNEALYQVATGQLPVESWLQEYGHRAPEEFDLATPRWRERPSAVTALARHLVHGASPKQEHQQRTAEAAARIARLQQSLSPVQQQQLDQHVALCHRYLRFREDGKHELMRGYELLRQMVLNAAQRLALSPHDLCLLTLEELAAALRDTTPLENRKSKIENLLHSRRDRRAAESRLSLPDVISAAEIETMGELHLPPHTDRLEAFPLSTGAATGLVRIVASPESAGDLGTGYILVCRSTDPSWTPLFVNAAGIVLECGGALSHGAVVAREMAKPAVVLPNATQILTEDQPVAIDATHGAVLLNTNPALPASIENPKSEIENRPPNPLDTRIAWNQIPPAPGAREKSSARLRNISAIFWLLFLAIVFLIPQTHLRQASLSLLDKILWPIFQHAGGLATVAIIAAALAFLSMLAQWALTDTPRLREARRRAAFLKKQAARLPPDSPRRKKLLSLAAPVQTRLTLAAFVPLALLLGPMVMSFLWLPERLDPASANPRPGATAIISALIDPDYAGGITLTSPLAPEAATQVAIPLRSALLALAQQLEQNQVPPLVAARLQQTSKSPAVLLPDLRNFLAAPLPPQTLTWSLPTRPDQAGIYQVTLAAKDAPSLSAPLILGNIAPPPLNIETDEKGNRVQTIAAPANTPIRSLRIRYSDSRRTDPAPFFAPFTALGWSYDFGWLGAYLLIYIAALFLARRIFRIP